MRQNGYETLWKINLSLDKMQVCDENIIIIIQAYTHIGQQPEIN
jgi:hypothetical protein